MVIQFREGFLGAEFFTRPEMAGVRLMIQAAGRGLQFCGRTRDAVAAVMLEMRKHSELEQLIDLLTIFKLLAQAGHSRTLSSPAFIPSLDDRAGDRINRVYQHVFKHFSEPLSYKDIAKEAGMTLSAFCHYFKRVTGRPLSEFVLEVRMGHARKLLIETTEGIAQVAYASGFQSLSTFNRRFLELSGINPTQFRRHHQTH
jgi:AraC-like DNA-binding protein